MLRSRLQTFFKKAASNPVTRWMVRHNNLTAGLSYETGNAIMIFKDVDWPGVFSAENMEQAIHILSQPEQYGFAAASGGAFAASSLFFMGADRHVKLLVPANAALLLGGGLLTAEGYAFSGVSVMMAAALGIKGGLKIGFNKDLHIPGKIFALADRFPFETGWVIRAPFRLVMAGEAFARGNIPESIAALLWFNGDNGTALNGQDAKNMVARIVDAPELIRH